MERYLVFIAAFLVNAWSVNAQTGSIKGHAIDGGRQAPVEFASVTLYTSGDTSLVQGTLTDTSGYFEIANVKSGVYIITITSIEYQKVFRGPIQVDADHAVADLGHVTMTTDQKLLHEVVVKGARQLVEQRPNGIIVNLENSILSKGRSGTELLGVVPLVNVGMGGGISVRGKTNVLVLIDNKPYYGETLTMMLSNMKSEDIVKIEVDTNPSARYDAAASGGVIHIITRKATQNGFTGQFDGRVSQGERLRWSPRLNLGYRYNKLSMFVNLGYSFYDGKNNQHLTNLYRSDNQLFRNDGVHNYKRNTVPVSAGVSYHVNKANTLGFTFDNTNDKRSDNIHETAEFFLINEDSPLLNGTVSKTLGESKNHLYNYSAYYEGRYRKSSLNFVSTFSKYTSSSLSDIFYYDFNPDRSKVEDSDTRINTSNGADIKLLVSQLDYNYDISEKTSFEVGVKGMYTQSDNSIDQFQIKNGVEAPIENPFGRSGYEETILAGYFTFSQEIGKLKLNGGIRAEQTQSDVQHVGKRDFLNFFPSFLIHSKPSDNYQWAVSFSRKINRPAFSILIPFVAYSGKYTIRQGNPTLTPQYNNNLEFTQIFKQLNVVLGYTHVKNAMFDIPKINDETKVTTFLYQNMDSQDQYSLSLVFPFHPLKQVNSSVTLYGGYTVLNDAGLNQNVAFNNAAWSGYGQMINTISLPNQWKGEVLFYYQTPRLEGIDRLKSTSSLDFGIGRPIFNQHGNIKLSVSDVFRQRRWRGTSHYGNVNMTVNNFYDTRRVQLSFSYNFGKKTVKKIKEKSLGNEDQRGRMY